MTKKFDIPLTLLAVAAFLAPLIGGQVVTEALPLPPDSNSFWAALTGGPETPMLSHAILALLCSASIAIALFQRKIVQVPNNIVTGALIFLLALVVGSVAYSDFKSSSIPAAMEWFIYGIALFAVVASVGRRVGPVVIMAALFAGCVALGLLGLQEYGVQKAIDPTWRVFPHWVGPNAMAAILLVGFFIGLGLAGILDRVPAIASGIGTVVIGVALFLTQSKGGLLSLACCLTFYGVLVCVWLPRERIKRAIASGVVIVALVSLMAVSMSFTKKAGLGHNGAVTTGSPLGRLTGGGTTSEQSVGFRKLLWQSAIDLIERNPIGTGPDTFQYLSSKPGLITQTKLAHEAYLQLAVESSGLALVAFVVALAWWFRLLLRGGKNLTPTQNWIRASIAAAVGAVLVHSLIDSDFSYFGIGLAVFMLMGVGLLVSTDGVAPEFLPPTLRHGSALAAIAVSLFLGYLGLAEATRAQVRYDIGNKKYSEAQDALDSLRSMVPWDAEVWELTAESSTNVPQQTTSAQKAVDLAPSTRNLRLLVRMQAQAGMYQKAIANLNWALTEDPNNLQGLLLLSEIQAKAGLDQEAHQTLVKLVGVEKKPYLEERSLPELVPTETYHARLILAQTASTNQEKIDYIQPAIEGYKQYAIQTVPNVLWLSKGAGLDYAGESIERAKDKMTEAQAACKWIASLYRSEGKAAPATDADADASLFGTVLDSLSFK